MPTIISERTASLKTGRHNADAAEIERVKIVGLESANGRRYAAEALKNAVALYEGAPVHINHANPPTTTTPRDYRDRIGTVKNVIAEREGLFATLCYNPRHPLAGQLTWDAEHAPQNLGLSHVAQVEEERKNGQTTITRIVAVRSIDIVTAPATTRGLYEHQDQENRQEAIDEALARQEEDAGESQSHRETDAIEGRIAAVEKVLAEIKEAVTTKAPPIARPRSIDQRHTAPTAPTSPKDWAASLTH